MATYQVEMVIRMTAFVSADSKAEAKELVIDQYEDGEYQQWIEDGSFKITDASMVEED